MCDTSRRYWGDLIHITCSLLCVSMALCRPRFIARKNGARGNVLGARTSVSAVEARIGYDHGCGLILLMSMVWCPGYDRKA